MKASAFTGLYQTIRLAAAKATRRPRIFLKFPKIALTGRAFPAKTCNFPPFVEDGRRISFRTANLISRGRREPAIHRRFLQQTHGPLECHGGRGLRRFTTGPGPAVCRFAIVPAVAGRGRVRSNLQVKVSPSDLVQETLMEAYQSFEKFEGKTRAELLVWLQGILNHRLQTAQRKYHKAEMRNLRRETHVDQAQASGSRWAVLDNDQTSPSGAGDGQRRTRALEAAITRLPDRTRDKQFDTE